METMENKSAFGLLIGVGNYEQMNIVNLPTYKLDLALLGTSLMAGLKLSQDNIRFLSGQDNNGYVTTQDLAREIANFRSLLGSEDTFILYFSGHGRDKNLIFSNGQVELQSVIDFVDKLPAKNKIVILDCCYSGNFTSSGARMMSFDSYMDEFAGRGIAVLASSAANEVSMLGPNGNHSMFTGALSTAMLSKKRIRKGQLTLKDIYDETMQLVGAWNNTNPDKEQQPIFRSSIGGTIFFMVEEYHPYEQMEISKDMDEYKIVKVEPLSSLEMKRLCAFVVLNERKSKEELSRITKEIAEEIKYAEVYSNAKSEAKFSGTPAKAVWCYFGYDDSDIINHLHAFYTIWAVDDSVRTKFFGQNKNACVVDDIYIFENTSYDMLRKMQEPTQTREEFIEDNRRLLAVIVNLGEQFIVDLQEVKNKTIIIEEMQKKYGEWVTSVREKYMQLSDGDIAPDDLHDWSEEIMSLAGWILDLSIHISKDKEENTMGDRENWLIDYSIKKYYESVEKIKQIEDEIDW